MPRFNWKSLLSERQRRVAKRMAHKVIRQEVRKAIAHNRFDELPINASFNRVPKHDLYGLV